MWEKTEPHKFIKQQTQETNKANVTSSFLMRRKTEKASGAVS